MRYNPEMIRIFNGWWHGGYSTHNRNGNGNLYVRYLYWNDGRWNWNSNWLDNSWNANNPAVLLATLFISPPFL